jgi:hypothetical protein
MALAGNGLYVTAGDEINTEGEWWTLLDIMVPDDNAPQRIAFAWVIDAAASIPTELPPRLPQILSLLAVIAAMAFAAYPAAQRLYRWLDWRPSSVATAATAIALSAALILVGIYLVDQSQRQYEALLNPPPQRVNPVLPDASSVTEGQRLFLADCSAWGSQTRELRNYLLTKGDEDLYDLTLEGWRELSPCSDNLSEEERWHIVNFIRTIEE